MAALCLAIAAFSQSASALGVDDSGTSDEIIAYDPEADEALYLLVSINGREIGLIAEFALHAASQRMSAQRDELEGIGIAAPRNLGRTVFLDAIPGLAFIYDAEAQTLHITAPQAALIPVEISAVPLQDLPETQTGFGLVLNYRVTANLGDNIFSDGFQAEETYASLDLRAYSPLGVLTTTGAVAMGTDGATEMTRHDTYFTASSPGKIVMLVLGDFTTAGLAWSRPVRLGGVQIRRDFSLRDDVVTSPLLSYSGTASVPSSIDVYVDNVRAYSGAVGPGPFNLTNVPMITSDGEAIFVLRDAGGNEEIRMVPFFATQNLLAVGMLDYSVEAGRPRADFDDGSDAYGASTAVSVSLRYGLTDHLTIGGHAETMDDLRMIGLGVDTVLFNRAEATLSAGASVEGAESGGFVFAALRTEVLGVGVRASSRRTFGDYNDLASVTARDATDVDDGVFSIEGYIAQDALSVSFPDLGNGGSFGLNLINSERSDMTNTILSASYAQPLNWASSSLRVNAFGDLSGDGGYGVSLGISMPLGKSSHATAGALRDHLGRTEASASLSRTAGRQPGSIGYRIDVSPRNTGVGLTYQTAFGRAELSLREGVAGASGSATLDGTFVAAGGGVFAGNRVQDGFAIVKLGIPGVAVSLNNREVARTGLFGRAMVSDLRSYRLNKISIDPLDLPIDAYVGATAMDVVPARRSGVSVDFGGSTEAAALVVLRDAAGAFLQPGADVRLKGSSTEFTVGYDGEVWLEGLGSHNRITVQSDTGTCSAEFDYAEIPGEQIYIDGVECR